MSARVTARRAIIAWLLTTIFSACSRTPAAPQASPPADIDVFGLWAVEGGAYVEVSPGIATKTFDLVVHSHPPRSIHDVPTCIAYDVPLGAYEIDCRVALERCVQALT